MKKLIVTLMVLSALVSCGKTNAVGNSSVFGTSPITVGGSTETQLGSMIDNNQFGTGYYYYDTYAGAIAKGASPIYDFGSYSNASNCKTKWGGFLVICTSSGSSSTTIVRTVNNRDVDLVTKKNELKAIINNRNYIQSYGTSFYIRTNDGRAFVIDTRYPLQANPVTIQEADGKGQVLVNVR